MTSRRIAFLVAAGVVSVTDLALGQKPVEQQIVEAVRPLPEPERAGATVLGYRHGAELEVIRSGNNRYICLADPPGDTNFAVSCYQRELEPFMARGRSLRAEGKASSEVRDTRRAEIEANELPMPDRAVLISMFGRLADEMASPDSVTGLHVIYLPYATAEQVGFPTTPGAGPWLMDAGQHRAHVMFSTPKQAFRSGGER